MAKQTVLFGGTFNPIHHGHLIVARAVAEQYGFDKVTLVPAYLPPHKREHGRFGAGRAVEATPEDRLAMVRLAVEGEQLFEVSDVEIRRGGPSYTFDTLAHVHAAEPEAELFWIIGEDMLGELPNWYRSADVVKMATIITAARSTPTQGRAEVQQNLEVAFGSDMASKLMANLAATPLIEISATDIRRRRKEGKSVAFLTPCAAISYMDSRQLYSLAAIRES